MSLITKTRGIRDDTETEISTFLNCSFPATNPFEKHDEIMYHIINFFAWSFYTRYLFTWYHSIVRCEDVCSTFERRRNSNQQCSKMFFHEIVNKMTWTKCSRPCKSPLFCSQISWRNKDTFRPQKDKAHLSFSHLDIPSIVFNLFDVKWKNMKDKSNFKVSTHFTNFLKNFASFPSVVKAEVYRFLLREKCLPQYTLHNTYGT